MFKTRLDIFGNDFGHFCNFEKFFIILKIFEDSTLMEHWAKKNLEKINPKHVQNTFGHFWERFWAFFFNFEKFFIILKIFEDSTFHGTLGKKKFSKKLTQNMFKTRLDTFGNDF